MTTALHQRLAFQDSHVTWNLGAETDCAAPASPHAVSPGRQQLQDHSLHEGRQRHMFEACHGGAWKISWPHLFGVTAHDAAQAVREAVLRTLDRVFIRLHGKPTLVRGSKHASHAPCMNARMHFRMLHGLGYHCCFCVVAPCCGTFSTAHQRNINTLKFGADVYNSSHTVLKPRQNGATPAVTGLRSAFTCMARLSFD